MRDVLGFFRCDSILVSFGHESLHGLHGALVVVSGTAAAASPSFGIVVTAVDLRHDGSQLDGQLFGQREPVVWDALRRLIAVEQSLAIRFPLEAVAPKQPVAVRQPDDFGVLEFAQAFLTQRRLPFRYDIAELKKDPIGDSYEGLDTGHDGAYLGFGFQPMFLFLFDGIIAKQGKSWLGDVAATNLLIQSHQELLDCRWAVESNDLRWDIKSLSRSSRAGKEACGWYLVGSIKEMDGDGVRQRMVVRIFQQDGEDFHAGRLGLARAHLKSSFESSLAVRSVFAHFGFSVGVADQMESQVPQQLVVARCVERYSKGQQLPSLHESERSAGRFGVASTGSGSGMVMVVVGTKRRRHGRRRFLHTKREAIRTLAHWPFNTSVWESIGADFPTPSSIKEEEERRRNRGGGREEEEEDLRERVWRAWIFCAGPSD